jgi:hypothetical protein
MIVRTAPGGLELITQPDHAHLAGRIMTHAVALQGRPRRPSILRAIAEHDNGWLESDAAPSVNASGAVVDFISAPLRTRHGVWPRGIEGLTDDPWAAALVAQHAITVYDRFRPDQEWATFFAEMEARRNSLLHRSGASLDALVSDYAFVRLGDLISLVFCTGWTEPQRFAEWTVVRSDTLVSVTPDLFGGMVIPIEIEARHIRRDSFASDVELREALAAAVRLVLRGSVRG